MATSSLDASKTSNNAPTTPTLLTLPSEIRLEIYEYLLSPAETVKVFKRLPRSTAPTERLDPRNFKALHHRWTATFLSDRAHHFQYGSNAHAVVPWYLLDLNIQNPSDNIKHPSSLASTMQDLAVAQFIARLPHDYSNAIHSKSILQCNRQLRAELLYPFYGRKLILVPSDDFFGGGMGEPLLACYLTDIDPQAQAILKVNMATETLRPQTYVTVENRLLTSLEYSAKEAALRDLSKGRFGMIVEVFRQAKKI
ncbi:MAG: hypothetical protein Q9227_004936 [Pyrenula ochraceoflavens]